ncbi:MAG: hypothetical protein U9O41_01020 [Candidatus Aerophobetes bacterium]|nr:hypothetical protein [Candidatus Aerophobetes bacterium]
MRGKCGACPPQDELIFSRNEEMSRVIQSGYTLAVREKSRDILD